MNRKIKKVDGIFVFYEKNKLNKGTYCEFGINCGAFCDKIPGIAHYTEHMFFTETKNLSHDEILKQEFLNRINAHTSFDTIQITFDQSSSTIEKCFEICSDMMFNSYITKDYVDKERNIIETEIKRKYTNPNNDLYFSHTQKLFSDKRFSYPTAGTTESIKKIKPQDLVKYKEKYFFKENFSVTIFTSKPFSIVKKLVQKYITKNLPSKSEKVENSLDSKICEKSFVNILKKDVQNSVVILNIGRIKTPENDIEKIKQIQILKYINSLLISKRLNKKLREEKSYIYSIMRYSFSTNKETVWGIKFETKNENIKPCLIEISNTIKDILKNGFSKEEFSDFVVKQQLSEDMDLTSPGNEIGTMQYLFKTFKKFWKDSVAKKIFYSITLEDVNKLFKEKFDFKNIYLSIMTNSNDKIITLSDAQKIFK